MNKIIDVQNLQKSYGSVQAVKGISFYAEAGKLFSFLGPNGAGKSTTIDILCSLLTKDAGDVWVDGHRVGEDDAAIRRTIGVVFQDSLLDDLLTVRENLTLRAGLYLSGRKAIAQAVQEATRAVDVDSFLNRPYGKLSGGQRRRADIARALLSSPKILILDEPTTGLDPQTRKNVWDTVRTLQRERGMTIFLTTHYMEEAADSDYVIVIDDGTLVAKGTPAALKAQYANDQLRLFTTQEDALAAQLTAMGLDYEGGAGCLRVTLKHTMLALDLLAHLRPYIDAFEVTIASMDDVFLGITGKGIRE